MTYQTIFKNHVSRLFKPGDVRDRLIHASMGISGESGELLDTIKKTAFYDKPLDTENVIEEIGDLLFYIQAMATECGFTLSEAMEKNIEKLNKRYPAGSFSTQAAQERADKAGE